MTQQFLSSIVSWLATFLCGSAVGVISAVAVVWRKDRAQKNAIVLGLQSLLRADIIGQHEKYNDMGFCPIHAKEALKRTYDSYHGLGGNDIATELYRKTMALPEEPPEK